MTAIAGRTQAEHTHAEAADAVRSPASLRGHPIHPMLVPLPIGLLTGALAADILYVVAGDALFAQMAVWLVGGGLATGLLATAFGLVDFVALERPRRLRAGWLHAIGNALALLVAAGSLVVRLAMGAAEAVVPWGLAASLVTGLLLAITGWYGGELVYRQLVGVRPADEVLRESPRRELK